MEYHYQWPEYIDPTLSEGSGCDSCFPPPPISTDTPTIPPCLTRFYPRGRSMRRRRLFPPPFNHFGRSVRPPWSTYYDYGVKWNPTPQISQVCPSQFENCYDYEFLLDKTSTEKPLFAPARKNWRDKGTSQQLKPVQVIKNSDQSSFRSDNTDWIEQVHQTESNSSYRTAQDGHQSLSISSINIFVSECPGDQESSQSPSIPVINNESEKAKNLLSNFDSSVMSSAEESEKYFTENVKEDKLTSIINRTLYETSKGNANNCQDNTESSRNRPEKVSTKLIQKTCRKTKSSDPCLIATTGNQENSNLSQNISDNSYNNELFDSYSVTNELPNETETAVFNLQQLDQPDSDVHKSGSCVKELFNSNPQNSCNSLVVYDSNKLEMLVGEYMADEFEIKINSTDNASSLNTRSSEDNDSNLCFSEKENSISELLQQNQLLTDLLSQLIAGNSEFQKNETVNNQLLVETENFTNKEIFEIPDINSFQTISELLPVNVFQNFDANTPAEPTLLLSTEEGANINCYSNDQSKNINKIEAPKFSEKIAKACVVNPIKEVDEFSTNNSLLIQANDTAVPTETFPSAIDFPNSDNESHFVEAISNSVQNYIPEEPLEDFPNSLFSCFEDENSLESLSAWVKPNSVLKVKKPRKRYVKTVESFKVKKKEKSVRKVTSKCKKITSKCLKMIRKCKHTICKEEEIDSDENYGDSEKVQCDAEVQVDQSDIEKAMMESISRSHDAETQCGFSGSTYNNLHEIISFKKDLQEQYKYANSFEPDTQSNNRGKRNFLRNEEVFVMLMEIPVSLKKMSMDGHLNVGVIDHSNLETTDDDLNHATEKDLIDESVPTMSDSKIETLAISYEDSFEGRISSESKRNHNRYVEPPRNNHIIPISKPQQSKDLIKDISHVSLKMSTNDQRPAIAKNTPYVPGGSDRVLRKRKYVNYSDPVPTKRLRLNSSESDVQFVNNEESKNVKIKNLNFSGTKKCSCSKSNKLLRNQNSQKVFKNRQNSKAQSNKSLRRKTG